MNSRHPERRLYRLREITHLREGLPAVEGIWGDEDLCADKAAIPSGWMGELKRRPTGAVGVFPTLYNTGRGFATPNLSSETWGGLSADGSW